MMYSTDKSMDAETPQQDLRKKYQLFFEILQEKKLTPLFQPIINLSRRTIYGYESLIRGPADGPYHSPVTLFDTAIRCGSLLGLDLLCSETGINSFQEQALPGKLFINTAPESLLEPGYHSSLSLDIIGLTAIQPENIVIEMTEPYTIGNFDVMRKAIEYYRLKGFEIAIDLGIGASDLSRWSELRPDYVKIDKHFIRGINDDTVKQSFVRSINDIAQRMDCKVIAEGIETQDEYRTIFRMGIEIGQGYFFAQPKLVPPYFISNEVFNCSSPHDYSSQFNRVSENISSLLVKVPDISPGSTMEEIHRLFHNRKDLTSVPVLEPNGRPLGLIRRNNLLATLSTKFGRALYGTKSVVDFIDKTTVIADKEWNIEQVSKMVTDNMQSHIEDDFIITENGQYAGLGKVVQLLKKITDLQIKNARHANPLTLLPGNVPIYEKIDGLLSSNSKCCIAYCDIDNFKPFNDVYGYAKGDQIIKMVAEILLKQAEVDQNFVGHVGGDDFIVIFESDDWQARCEKILKSFEELILNYYNDTHKKDKGIWALTRNGDESFFPIMTLSIGALRPDSSLYLSYGDIAELSTQAKHNAKNIPGNSLFIERRVSR